MKRKKPAPPLTARQARFIREYLIDLNATQAAIRAGYAPKAAHVTASRLLSHAKVVEIVEKRMAQRSEKLDITADKVLGELAKLGFSNMQDYIETGPKGATALDLVAIDRNKAAAIQEINVGPAGVVKFKLHDKRGALVDLGRHLGLFPNKVEFTGPAGGPVEIVQMSPAEFEARAKRIADEV